MDGNQAMMGTPVLLGDARFFAHEAMKTTFTLRFADMPEEDARGIARECFELVDRLEQSLSRFIEGSEVWRINHLRVGETLYLSDACHRCLIQSMQGHEATGGLFDITIGRRIRHRKDQESGPEPELHGRLMVHPDVPAVTCEEEGRELDLGGIGKGFALDEMANLLGAWGVGDVLLAGGASSMRAVGTSTWPIDLAGDADMLRLNLADASLSASGTGIQGAHIVHPVGGAGFTGPTSRRVWVTAPGAAESEIWSTAILLVPDEHLATWLSEGGGYERVFIDGKEGIRCLYPSRRRD